jgi:hypothetical protein
MPFQIFISYARNDDLSPIGKTGGKGFVSLLYDLLNYEFTLLGPHRPVLWRDRSNVELSGQFDPLIDDALNSSSCLMVVLSRNWLDRAYCRRELDLFAQRWSAANDIDVKRRIIVVGKNFVEAANRPKWLQGQQGYLFYTFDDPQDVGKAGKEIEFFTDGAASDDYYLLVRELARDAWRRAQSALSDEAKTPAPSAAR